MLSATYVVHDMDALYAIEVEPEIRTWLELLPGKLYRKVEAYAELLAALGPHTPMPYARPLRDGVSELRPSLDGVQTRVTYWIRSVGRCRRRRRSAKPSMAQHIQSSSAWKETSDGAQPLEVGA